MKKINLFLLVCLCIQLVSAQNFRKPYREAKRALKKKDYITATLKSAESLKAKNNFKKSNDIFKKALSEVNSWGANYIKLLEDKAIPYKDYRSVESMKKNFITYNKLDNVQKKLVEVSNSLSSKQKKFVLQHTIDYERKMKESENSLDIYNKNAANEFYIKGINNFKSATNKYEFREAFKSFKRSKSYLDDFKDVNLYLDKTLKPTRNY